MLSVPPRICHAWCTYCLPIICLRCSISRKATNYAACIIRFMWDEKGSLLRISGWRRTAGFMSHIGFLHKGVSPKSPLFAPIRLRVNVAARSCQKLYPPPPLFVHLLNFGPTLNFWFVSYIVSSSQVYVISVVVVPTFDEWWLLLSSLHDVTR